MSPLTDMAIPIIEVVTSQGRMVRVIMTTPEGSLELRGITDFRVTQVASRPVEVELKVFANVTSREAYPEEVE